MTEETAIDSPTRALLVSTVAAGDDTPARMGSASYSYYYVSQAFAPLLQRWGTVIDAAARQGRSAIAHLGFVPLEAFQPVPDVANAAFPFWDFPDLPDYALGGNPNSDWARIANGLDLILTCNGFTRDAFVRAGVRTPIHVVPVPVRPEYFEVPAHDAQQRVVIDCPSVRVTPVRALPRTQPPRGRQLYHRRIRPRLPRRWADALGVAAHALGAVRREWRDAGGVDCPAAQALELSGVVYTTVLNPFDQRKNWQDLLTAYLLALQDCDDATLVMKLVLPPDRAASGVNKVLRFHRQLGLAHRCRLALVSAYLTDDQMVALARGSTYYLNASRAEGACLPLQNFLAAGRPGIAPRHTAMADYFGEECGFVVASHPEPTSWPQDPDQRCTTTWHRLVWTSLHDQILEGYRVAKARPAEYRLLAAAARARMASLAGAEPVWSRLSAALDSLLPPQQVPTAHAL